MTKKRIAEPSEAEAKKRLKEFGRKHREKYPVPPVDENEPEGLLAGDTDKIKDRIEEEFDDDYGAKKAKLKAINKGDHK